MTTPTTTTTANPDSAAPPVVPAAARPRPARRSRWGRLGRAGFWAAALALVGLNAWRAWDARPSEPLNALQEWAAHGRGAEAEAELRRHLRFARHDGAARMALARMLAARKEYLACARELHEVPFWWPTKADALFLEGQAWKFIDRARDAEGAWEALTADDPLHPVSARYFSGAARELIAHYVLKGRLDEARRVLWLAYNGADPSERRDALLMRLRAELERVAHEEAVATLRRYAAADPTDWEARRALAVEEQIAARPSEADREIEACLKARPADPRAWRARLEIDHLRGDREALRADLRRLPPQADTDAEVWKYRGLAAFWATDFAAAADAFRRAAAIEPHEGEYFYHLGMAEQRLGHRDQAGQNFRRSRQIREAFEKLHEAYVSYQELLQREAVDEEARRAAIERLAAGLERLGWTREAEAWRKTLAG